MKTGTVVIVAIALGLAGVVYFVNSISGLDFFGHPKRER